MGVSRPAMQRSRLDLPLPLGPRSKSTSPAATRNDSAVKTRRSPRRHARSWPTKRVTPRPSRFYRVDDVAALVKTGGDQRPAEAAATVDAGGELTGLDAGMGALEAAHDADEAAVGAVELGEAAGAPPQRVALRRERPVGVEAGVDEEERAVIGIGGAAQRAHQRVMAGDGLHGRAQLAGPAGDGERAVAARDEALLDVAAIGGEGGAGAVLDHPGEDLARIGRELQLQQLLPHLLLTAAQVGDVGGERAGACDQLAPEGQQRIE